MKNAPPVAAILTRTRAASHSIFRVLDMLQGPLFMPRAGLLQPAAKPCHAPLERVTRGGIPAPACVICPHRDCYKIRWKRQCSRRNVKQMLTHPGTFPGQGAGSAPGFRVRVMGWYGGEEGEGYGYRITLWSAGALPGKILHELPGMCCIIPARIRETVRRFSVLLAHSISA